MTNRELVIDLVNELPTDTPLEEIIEKIRFIAGVKHGLAEAKRREGISTKEVRRKIKSWASKKAPSS